MVKPLGFELDDRKLRRAGLDYKEFTRIDVHESLPDCMAALGEPRVVAVSTRGSRQYDAHRFRPDDALLFGPETRGLPDSVLNALPADQVLRIPMQPGNRSLNLSNAAAIVLYEAWRQNGYPISDTA